MTTLKNCDECGKEFRHKLKKIRFCSLLCANINRGKKVARLNRNNGKWLICTTCKKEKSPSDFSYNIRNDVTSGKKTECKRCSENYREIKRRNRTWKEDAALILLNNSK